MELSEVDSTSETPESVSNDVATETPAEIAPTPEVVEIPPVVEVAPTPEVVEVPPVIEVAPTPEVVEVPPVIEVAPTPEVVEVPPVIEVAPTPVVIDVPPVAEVANEVKVDSNEAHTEEHDEKKNQKQEKFNEIYAELATKKENKELIEVEVKARIKGGMRVSYQEVPLFLPASHFSLKRTPTEQELNEVIGKTLLVTIHEIQEYDEGRKAVIVSRKQQLMHDFWETINVGDIVEGKVSSIASFGVFLDLGGVEGLIHISRLSQVRIDDPNKLVKKGETMKAVVVEIDKEKSRIALSRKELEESPWVKVEEQFPVGTTQKGIVRRLTDFGAYIEMMPGVDGLLRTPEISWTKRIKKPGDVLKVGEEIDVFILALSVEKQTISLSIKNTLPNPWTQLVDKYPVGAEFDGVVFQVMPQGIIVTLDNTVDGFMPRSKMKKLLQGTKIPYQTGDPIKIIIADLIPGEESLILSPKFEDEGAYASDNKPHHQKSREREDSKVKVPPAAGISLSDMLTEIQKKGLLSMD
jgi:ribosomal protein S1